MRLLLRPAVLALSLATAVTAVATQGGCLPGPDDGTSGGTSGTSGSSGSSGSSDGGDGSTITRAGQACLDMASAYATVGARCGDTYEASRTKFIAQLADGDCNKVSIRNETELRNQCLPTFSSLSCTNWREGRFAPSCAEQIIRPL